MRIALFLNLMDQKWTSLSMERYGVELRKNLDKIKKEADDIIGFQPSIPRALTYLPSRWRYQLSRFYYYPFYAQRHEGNVNHIIDHSFAQISQFLNHEKTVVTCHDLIPLKYLPDGTRVEKDPTSLDLFKKSVNYLKEVKCVIVDSEATKKDLISMLEIPESKIRVIYLGRNIAFQIVTNTTEVKTKLALPARPVLLHVGNTLPYKNLEKIFSCLKILKEEKVTFIFVKVGPEFTSSQKQLIEEFDLKDDIIEAGFLTEKELIQLYNLSSVLLYPSLFEGFGLPVLEALSCGLPAVISKNTSLEEIAGDTLIGVDPQNEQEISQEVKRLVNLKSEELKELKKTLVEQAEKFNWEKTAMETYKVYEDLNEN